MAGYTRQSSFVDGDTITAALFNDEYNQLVNAFHNATGHSHDGTAASGPVIGLIGDAGETAPNNKVLIDTTNNYIEFYVQVSSSPVQQLYIADGAIIPVTDNDIDLGTSSLEFKDLFIDGTAHVDTLDVDANGTVAGTLGVTGATTLSSTLGVTGAATLASTLAVTGNTTITANLTVNGNTTLGNAATDTVTVTADVASNLIPSADSTYALGDSSNYWSSGYIDAITTTGNVDVGGNLTVTGTTTFNGGTITMGDAATDNVVFGADVNSNVIPNTDNTYDLGSSSQEWKDLYVDGVAYVDAINFNGTAISSTAAELNIVDGGTSATSTTLVDADRVVVNDNGTMVQVALPDFETYFETALDTLSNVTTVGALNAGSITSGFGSIDNGSSAITTTGTVTYGSLSDGSITITAFVDEDNMSSNSATLVPTQQSVKAYVDAQVTAQDLDFQGDSGGALNIDLDSETLTIAGGTGIGTVGSGNTVTASIDSTVATLTGSQTLTNKTLTSPTINTPTIGTSLTIGSAAISEADIEQIDDLTAGTVTASKAVVVDSNKDIGSFRNITLTGELDAATLDISGDADIDGTLEADAYTVAGTALNEYIADTVGAMVSSNTETDITVSYDDNDNTLDFVVGNITGTAALATSITASANNSTDETVYPTFVDGATGTQGIETDTGLTYNPSSGILTGTQFTGAVVGNVTGNTSGTALTVTQAAQSAITSLGTLTTLTVDNITVNGNTITADSGALNLTPASGSAIVLDGTINVDAGVVTGATSVTSTAFVGALTGNVTGNVSGSSGSTTGNAATATLATTATVTDSTANTNFPVVFHNESNGLLDDTGALRYNPSTGELLVPNLTVAGTTTQVDTVTMNAQNAVIFEGATADAYETTLSIVDPTADRTQYLINQTGYIPVLAASTSTAITSTPAELNLLDGSAANTVVNSKGVIYGSSGEVAGTLSTAAQANITSVGTLTALTGGTGDFNWDSNTLVVDSSTNRVGIGNASPDVSLDIGSFTDAVHVPVGTTAQRPGSPAAGYFRYNTTTSKFEGYTDEWGSIGGGSGTNMDTNIFAGDGSDTTFTLSNAPDDENNLMVFIDGVYQAHDSFSVSGTTLTFSTAPANGRVITVYHSTTTVGGSNNTINTMTGDNSDTTLTLSVAPVHENNVQVYFDGVYQSKSNYSISGTTLTFSTAPPTGVLVEAITNTNTSSTTANLLLDADSDTKIQVEESSDEDIIRFDIAGAEDFTMTANNFNVLAGSSVNFADNSKINIGTGNDLQIYHDGSNSYIDEQGTGSLNIRSSTTLRLQNASGDNYLYGTNGGEVVLYHNNSPKLYTASGGVDVTGILSCNNNMVVQGGGSGSQITMKDSGGTVDGYVYAESGAVGFLDDDGHWALQHTTDARTTFLINNAEKMRIDSTGVGIGCTPGYDFELRTNDTSAEPAMVIRQIGTGDASIGFQTAGANNWTIGTDNSVNDNFMIAEGLDGADSKLVVTTGGNVGIGTASPDNKLTVASGSIKIAETNSRLYFGTVGGTDRRALEGATDGSTLQVGEGYTDIALQGNVGIGTTSPLSHLTFESDHWNTGTEDGPSIRWNNGITTADSLIQSFEDANVAPFLIGMNSYINSGGTYAPFNSSYASSFIYQGASGSILLGNASSGTPTTKMNILNSGYVGMGQTTDPAYNLVVNSTGDCVLQIKAGDTSWSALYFGEQSTAYRGIVQYNHNTDYMAIYTEGAETMRLSGGNSPNVMIGETSPVGTEYLTVSSNNGEGIVVGRAGTNTYRNYRHVGSSGIHQFISSSNTASLSNAGAWTDASDRAIKKDIEDIDYGLETVKILQPRKYKLKDDDSDQIGFIAQEMETIVPEVVIGEEGQKGISYGQITSILTKAIQEQQEQIEELKAKIETLETN